MYGVDQAKQLNLEKKERKYQNEWKSYVMKKCKNGIFSRMNKIYFE